MYSPLRFYYIFTDCRACEFLRTLSYSPLVENRLNAAADNTILCSAATQTGTEQWGGIKTGILAVCPQLSKAYIWLEHLYLIEKQTVWPYQLLINCYVRLEMRNLPCLLLWCGLTRRWAPAKLCSASSLSGCRKLESLPATAHKHKQKWSDVETS